MSRHPPGSASVRVTALALLVAVPGPALAHGAVQGIGAFYGGLLHPFVVPAHLVALLAVGVFSGQRGWRFVVAVMPVALLASAGGLALAIAAVEPLAQPLLLGAAAMSGLAAAAAVVPRLPTPIAMIWVAGIVFLIALDSPSDAGAAASRIERAVALCGTGVAIAISLAWIAGPLAQASSAALRIGVRVIGSWLAASALLVLALVVSGRPVG